MMLSVLVQGTGTINVFKLLELNSFMCALNNFVEQRFLQNHNPLTKMNVKRKERKSVC